jgi:excisionase family DNA binding protein
MRPLYVRDDSKSWAGIFSASTARCTGPDGRPSALLLTKAGAARYLGVSLNKLDALIADGRIATCQLDGRVRIKRAMLDAFAASL